MTSEDVPYRDALAAAHARVESLERELAGRRQDDHRVQALAALERERARCMVDMAPRDHRWVFVWRIYVPLVGGALIFLFDGQPGSAALCVPIALGVHLAIRAYYRSAARDAARQLELVDAKIKELAEG